MVILLLSTTLASHSRGLWPGDDWFGRSGYFIARFSLETLLFLGTYYLMDVIPVKLKTLLRLFIAFLISWPIFVLSITMFDVIMGHPELHGALQGDGSRLVEEIIDEAFWILPKHISFCFLVALINFRLEHQNLFNFRFNFNKPGTEKLPQPENSPGVNELIRSIPNQIRESILRVQAQEHYITVTTCLGSEMILYKFGKALIDLEIEPGLQVHRSYWVADENVLGWSSDKTKRELKLKFGESVPVSRKFEQAVKNRYKNIASN